MAETYEIEIVNWEKFNPRKDQKVHSWYRAEVDFFAHPIIGSLNSHEFKIWHFLLSQRAKTEQKVIVVTTEMIRRFCKVRTQFLHSLIKVLQNADIIQAKFQPTPDQLQTNSRPTPDKVLPTTDKTEEKSIYIVGDLEKPAVTDSCPTNERTNVTIRNTPVVPIRGHRKKINYDATRFVAKIVVAALQQNAGEDDARRTAGEEAWGLLRKKYPNWQIFIKLYQHAIQNKKANLFELDLKNVFAAFLEEKHGIAEGAETNVL